jgi:septal ring factor EnvC (AmiA/AmiB activator)
MMAGLPAEEAISVTLRKTMLGFILGSVTIVAHAAGPSQHLLKEFQQTKTALISDEVKQRKVMGALFDISHKMKKIVGEKAELEQEKLILESNIKDLAQKITGLEHKTKTQKALLRNRLAAIYKLGGPGVARILFSSSSSGELERNLKILGIVAQKDVNLIKDYADSKKELESRKVKLNQRWAHLKKIESKIMAKEAKLAQENETKGRILKNIKSSQSFALMKLKDIRKKSQQLAETDEAGVLDLLFQPSFFEQKRKLPQPIQGHLTQGFGLIKDEAHNVVFSHKGQFYSAPIGTQVKAIFQGKVAFAGAVPGFGQTLVIDHGDHYYSVYSHTQDLKVKEGDQVQQLQTLASSGHAGGGFGDGLYFEIRHFSEPSDPQQWVKGNTL